MLELKVPPPIVTLIIAVTMWAVASITPAFKMGMPPRIAAALVLSLLGGMFALAGAISFRRARTTVNPLKPEKTSALVSSGLYRVTRNPMYVGLLFVLIGWAVFLVAPVTLVGPVGFVAYMNRFQIEPEELVLSQLFGNDYSEYKSRVRRWF